MLPRVGVSEVVGVAVETFVVQGVRVKRGGAGRWKTCADLVRCAGCWVSGVDECRRLVDVAGCCEACVQLVRLAGCCEACGHWAEHGMVAMSVLLSEVICMSGGG